MIKNIEKHSFSISVGVAITVIIFLLGIAASFSGWKIHMEEEHKTLTTGIEHIVDELEASEARIERLELDNTELKVKLASIEAKLINMEIMLIEIRDDLRNR